MVRRPRSVSAGPRAPHAVTQPLTPNPNPHQEPVSNDDPLGKSLAEVPWGRLRPTSAGGPQSLLLGLHNEGGVLGGS